MMRSFKNLCIHLEKFCALPRNFFFVCKSFALPLETLHSVTLASKHNFGGETQTFCKQTEKSFSGKGKCYLSKHNISRTLTNISPVSMTFLGIHKTFGCKRKGSGVIIKLLHEKTQKHCHIICPSHSFSSPHSLRACVGLECHKGN